VSGEAPFTVDEVDLKARIKAAKVIHDKFKPVIEDVLKGRPPKLVIKKRTLSNTIFDPEKGILVLGEETLEREYMNLHETRKFMQTLLMASIIYQSLVENEYPTIRDLYYKGKHTIVYRDPLRGRREEENTWDEQKESDSVIQDVEVYTGLFREDMLILSKEKGKVVGNMRIRSGNDVIDLSRLGHGAYAIESTPDLIEILDIDAEFVLVVEKDAVFQQLHRIGFWRRYKAILITGSGQPDRATRRFVRRLNEEHNLPVYVITDSIPAYEIVAARIHDKIYIGPVEGLAATREGVNRSVLSGVKTLSWSPRDYRVRWRDAGYIYSHSVGSGEVVEVMLESGRRVRVTGGHSLYVVRDGRLTLVRADEARPGDLVPVVHPAAVVSLDPVGAAGGGVSEAYNAGRSLAAASGVQRVAAALRLNASPAALLAAVKGALDRTASLDSRGNIVADLDEDVALVLFNALLLAGVEARLEGRGSATRLIVSKSPIQTPRPVYRYLAAGGDPGRAYREGLEEIARRGLRRPGARRGTITMTSKLRRLKLAGLRIPPVVERILSGDASLERIAEIRRAEATSLVYDIAVPIDNTFTAGAGVVVHNSDPYGWYIYSVYKVGSINLSYESIRLATPKAKFLGVSMSDIFGYGRKKPYLTERERKNFIIKAKEEDIKRAKELLSYSWFRTKKWQIELKMFLEKKAKLEIEAMASKGLKFFAFKYIPEKIETGDWIE